mgnify:CR=1 FL=1
MAFKAPYKLRDTQKYNLREIAKQTLLNILSVKGVIYTYYRNKQLKENQRKKLNVWATNELSSIQAYVRNAPLWYLWKGSYRSKEIPGIFRRA